MGLPRIRYALSSGNVDLDFGEVMSSLTIDPQKRMLSALSVSGKQEDKIMAVDLIVDVSWEDVQLSGAADDNLKRKLRTFKSIAPSVDFYFMRDTSKTVNTTLATSAPAGSTAVIVSDTTGITAGDEYVVRNDRDYYELKVSSIAGTIVILTSGEPLPVGFSAGDRFRSKEYWLAKLISLDIIELPPLNFGLRLRLRESI